MRRLQRVRPAFQDGIDDGRRTAQVLMVAGMFGFQFLGALYLQRVLRYGPADTGFAYLPVAVTIAVLSLGARAAPGARWEWSMPET